MILRNINCLVYWIRLTVKSTLIYNRRVLLQMLRIFLNFAVMLFLWTALIENQIKVDTSLDTLILYSAVSTLISCVVQGNVISSFFQRELATGDIAVHLFRPVPLEAVAVANGIGASVTGILLYGAAFLLVLVFFVRPESEITVLSSAAFARCLLAGFVVYILLDLCCAYLCFYIHRGTAVQHLIEALFMAFSGQVIPLFLLPEWFQEISVFLPVRLVYEDPISILLNLIPEEQWGMIYLRESLWIGGLFCMAVFLGRITRRRVFVQGG